MPQAASSFAGLGQLVIPLGEDLLFASGKFVLGSDVANGAVQADAVVVFDKISDKPARVIERERNSNANAIAFERFVPALDFTV